METWGYHFNDVQPEDKASLFEEGPIDSFGVLDLIVFLEDAFEIAISDDDMDADNIDSIGAICAFVTRKQAG